MHAVNFSAEKKSIKIQNIQKKLDHHIEKITKLHLMIEKEEQKIFQYMRQQHELK